MCLDLAGRVSKAFFGFNAFYSNGKICPDIQFTTLVACRIHRIACLCVTGSIRSTPSEALSVPIDINTKYVVACTAAKVKAAVSFSKRSPLVMDGF